MRIIELKIGDTVHSVRPEFALIERIEDKIGMNTLAFYRENLEPKPDLDPAAPRPSEEDLAQFRAELVAENGKRKKGEAKLTAAEIEDRIQYVATPRRPIRISTRQVFDIAAVAGAYASPPFSRNDLVLCHEEEGMAFFGVTLEFVRALFASFWVGNKRDEAERKAQAALGVKSKDAPENPTS